MERNGLVTRNWCAGSSGSSSTFLRGFLPTHCPHHQRVSDDVGVAEHSERDEHSRFETPDGVYQVDVVRENFISGHDQHGHAADEGHHLGNSPLPALQAWLDAALDAADSAALAAAS